MKKRILSVAIISVIALGTITAAARSVGGGIWTYGESLGTVYSNYSHDAEVHGSSVVNGDNQQDTDYNRQPGETSHASIRSTAGLDQSFYCKGYR